MSIEESQLKDDIEIDNSNFKREFHKDLSPTKSTIK